MTSKRNFRKGVLNVHVKQEWTENCRTTVGKRECLRIFENVEYSQDEKLELITNVIENETSIDDQIRFRSHRAHFLFDLKQYDKVLGDLKHIEDNKKMTEALYILKWKSLIHSKMKEIRDEILEKVDGKEIKDDEHQHIVNCINQINVDKLISATKKRIAASKRIKKQ